VKKLSQIIPLGLFLPVVFFLLAILSFLPVMAGTLTGMDPDLAKKVTAITPIRGMCYVPKPSDAIGSPGNDHKYFDSAFTNSHFPGLWGTSIANARGDLKQMKDELNVNFIRTYDWSTPPPPGDLPQSNQRNHLPFLEECRKLGIMVMVSVSRTFVRAERDRNEEWSKNGVREFVHAMVAEVYQGGKKPHPAADMWGIGNEIFASSIDPKWAAVIVQYIIEKEELLGVAPAEQLLITVPVTFGTDDGLPPSISAIQKTEAAFKANAFLTNRHVWEKRFIASPQPQNAGPFLRNYIDNTFPSFFPGVPFFFGEVAAKLAADDDDLPDPNWPIRTEEKQAEFVAGQVKEATTPTGNYIGMCMFQWENQILEKNAEKRFGINKFAGAPTNFGTIPTNYWPGKGEKYPIDPYTQKPSYDSVRNQWAGKGELVGVFSGGVWAWMNNSSWKRLTSGIPFEDTLATGDLDGQ
jgi:hypothetical protein